MKEKPLKELKDPRLSIHSRTLGRFRKIMRMDQHKNKSRRQVASRVVEAGIKALGF